jgi:hypothetical protein
LETVGPLFRAKCDLGAPQAHLQADGEDCPVAQAGDGIFGRRVEHLARLHLGEGERRAFAAIDRRPLDLADGIARGVAVAHQVLIERRQRREASVDRRRRGVLGFAHEAFPGDHRFVVGLAQLCRRDDPQPAHEVLHVEPVGAAGAGALLLGKPGDLRELRHGGDPDHAGGGDRHWQCAGVVDHRATLSVRARAGLP